MLSEDTFFQSRDDLVVWQRYCGFLDLSMQEFMQTQERLLLEQIGIIGDCPLGQKIMGGKKPATLREFRETVPVTTYEAYLPFLAEQREDCLPEKPYFWVHTSGRGGDFKWVPYTTAAFDIFGRYAIAAGILGSASMKGEVKFRPNTRMLLTMAPRPYSSGSLFYYLSKMFTYRSIPSLDEAENLEFMAAVEKSFQQALRYGVDHIAGISSVLVKIGEKMAGEAGSTKLSPYMLHPRVLVRLLRGLVRARLQGRRMVPRDLWKAKAVLTGGGDCVVYKDDLIRYWGQQPFEIYLSSEVMMLAMQSWNKKWLTFLPQAAFWEFIPEDEWQKNMLDPAYQPKTVLFDELKEGNFYEVVLTHFYGMPLLRYRIGDLVNVISLEDVETGVKLPQFSFKARADGIIDLSGMTKLDEKTVWKAISNSSFKYEDWAARKEYENGKAYMRIYLELKETLQPEEVERRIDEHLKLLDPDYRDVERLLELQPIRVTLLSKGTFERYLAEKKKQGAHLGHLKPLHINPSDESIVMLQSLNNH